MIINLLFGKRRGTAYFAVPFSGWRLRRFEFNNAPSLYKIAVKRNKLEAAAALNLYNQEDWRIWSIYGRVNRLQDVRLVENLQDLVNGSVEGHIDTQEIEGLI